MFLRLTRRLGTLLTLGSLAAPLAAHAQGTLGQYSFTGASGSELTYPVDAQPTNAVFSPMRRGSGSPQPSAGANAFAATNWPLDSMIVDTAAYFAFRLTANANFELDIDSLYFAERRSNTGPRKWQVRSSIDNYSSITAQFSIPDNANTRAFGIGLTAGNFSNLPSIEFRFYATGAEASGGSWRIDNVRLSGLIGPSGPPIPTVRFGAAAQTLSEGAGTVQVPVTLTNPSATTATVVQVRVATSPGTATAGTDYTFITQNLTFPAGSSTTQNAALTLIDDAIIENAETVVLTLASASSGVTIGTPSTYTLTIQDNDSPTGAIVQFAAASRQVPESIGAVQIPVTLQNPSATATTVRVRLANASGTATAGTDYTFVGGAQTLSFAANDTSRRFVTLAVIDDQLNESTETVRLLIDSVSAGVTIGANGLYTLSIRDNDSTIATAPTVQFAGATLSVSEGAAQVSVPVTLINPSATSSTSVQVQLAGSPGTATLGSDYSFTTQTLIFPAGSSAPLTATVTITDDATIEGAETIVLLLDGGAAGTQLGTPNRLTLTIIDNDSTVGPPPITPPLRPIAVVSVNDGQGVALFAGQAVRVRGIAISPNVRTAGYQLALQDRSGGIGLFRSTSLGTQVINQGDSLEVVGVVGQFNGLTQIAVDSFRTLLQNQPMPIARVVTNLDETTESELIKLNGPLTLVNPSQWATGMGSGFTAQVTDGTNTYDLRVVRNTDVFNAPAPTQPFRLTGVGGQFDSSSPFDQGYQITPRALTDFEFVTGLNEGLTTAALTLYPNPATDQLTVRAEAATATVVDALGRVVRTVSLTSGAATLDVSALPAGVYVVRAGATRSRFIKQ